MISSQGILGLSVNTVEENFIASKMGGWVSGQENFFADALIAVYKLCSYIVHQCYIIIIILCAVDMGVNILMTLPPSLPSLPFQEQIEMKKERITQGFQCFGM